MNLREEVQNLIIELKDMGEQRYQDLQKIES